MPEIGRAIREIGEETVLITSAVIAMMLLVEYLNVLTAGRLPRALASRGLGQYAVAALLGASPGCLGAFAVVAMYAHRVVSIGAVAAAMVATMGDEAFVMLALVPGRALLLMAFLAVLGIAAGWLADRLLRGRIAPTAPCPILEIHKEDLPVPPSPRAIARNLARPSPTRGILCAALTLFILGVATGEIGRDAETWIRATLVVVAGLALLIAAAVPEHFLEEHLWEHVVREHAPGILLWTLLALTAIHLGGEGLDLDPRARVAAHPLVPLLLACLVGLIPASGPHMVFVAAYAKGWIPFGVLLANATVQEGHGLIPLLAHSRRDCVLLKAMKVPLGLALGLLALLFGS